jgi:hypothetical protein
VEHLLKMFAEEAVLLQVWEQTVYMILRTRGLRKQLACQFYNRKSLKRRINA